MGKITQIFPPLYDAMCEQAIKEYIPPIFTDCKFIDSPKGGSVTFNYPNAK
jgi:hypothetical protein